MKAVSYTNLLKLHFFLLLCLETVSGVCSPTFAASPTLEGCQMFPADNIWNTPVDSLPVDSLSDQYITSMDAARALHPDFGQPYLDGNQLVPIGIPYTVVNGSQPKVPVLFDYDDESDPGPYPIPPDAPIEGVPDWNPNYDGDRHILVLDRDNCLLYETFYSWPQNNGTSWSAGSGAIFDLKSNALRPDGWTSADAAGLPILPGLVRYDEVEAGEINHAIRFTVVNTREDYVWPARHHAGSSTNPSLPPMGQRFRLKANFDISGFTQPMQVILRAMKKYGLILADNGSNWYISGTADDRWDNDMLVEGFRKLKGGDFEAVDVSSLMVDPNSGQAKQSTPSSPANKAQPWLFLLLSNSTSQSDWWKPKPGTSWQWHLDDKTAIDTSLEVDMFDIDYETPKAIIDELHTKGITVICYMSVGSWEEYRSDASKYPASILGNTLYGWPDEKWVDIRQLEILGPILEARMDIAVTNGCDGIEPDNVDGYDGNNSGFDFNAQDQIVFNKWVAEQAHKRNLSVGLKNDLAQVVELEPYFDWALNEECFQYNECDALLPFVQADKAVFGVEYEGDTAVFCPEANKINFDWLKKNKDLDAWRYACR